MDPSCFSLISPFLCHRCWEPEVSCSLKCAGRPGRYINHVLWSGIMNSGRTRCLFQQTPRWRWWTTSQSSVGRHYPATIPPSMEEVSYTPARLQGPKCGSQGFDETVTQLIPMFNGSHIRLPIRILREREVLRLSGLENLWMNTSIEDAERLPEKVIRDYCGNSFHPGLISCALGNDLQLLQWVNGMDGGSDTAVADKNTVLKIYIHLCQEVEQLGAQQGVKLGTHVVKEPPPYPDPIDLQRHIPLPEVHDALLVGPRKPKQSKKERFIFNCNQAVVHHLGVPLSQVLRNCGLDVCFDAFRAPVTTTFQFEYFRFIFGCYAGQLASGVVGQGPDLSVVGQLQAAFQRFAQCNTRLALLDCLTAASCSNGNSRWPVGHFVVFRESA